MNFLAMVPCRHAQGHVERECGDWPGCVAVASVRSRTAQEGPRRGLPSQIARNIRLASRNGYDPQSIPCKSLFLQEAEKVFGGR